MDAISSPEVESRLRHTEHGMGRRPKLSCYAGCDGFRFGLVMGDEVASVRRCWAGKLEVFTMRDLECEG